MFKKSILILCLLVSGTSYARQDLAQFVLKEKHDDFISHVQYLVHLIDQISTRDKLATQNNNFVELLNMYCLDQDFEDHLQMIHKNSSIQYTLNCSRSDLDTPNKIFYFVVDISNLKVIEAFVVDSSLEEYSKNKQNINFVIRQVIAVAGSTALSGVLAQGVFNGQSDKLKHSAVSALMSSVVTSASYHYFKTSPKKSAIIGFATSCAIGLTKEIWDRGQKNHTSDVRDMKANLIGCALGAFGMKIALEF